MAIDRNDEKFPCPCCGYRIFERPPGSESICRVCYWFDAGSGLKYAMERPGGPNPLSLFDAQILFEKTGFSEANLDFTAIENRVKDPRYRHYQDYRDQRHRTLPDAIRDSQWRKIAPLTDKFLSLTDRDTLPRWPEDMTHLYYWRDNYWLKSK